MRKQDVAKPVNRDKCKTCEYFNDKKKCCVLKTCVDQLSLFDIIGNRF